MPPSASKDSDSPSQPQDTLVSQKRSKASKKQKAQQQLQKEHPQPPPVPLPPPPLLDDRLPDDQPKDQPPQEVPIQPQDPPIYARQIAKSPPFAFRTLNPHSPRQPNAMISPDLLPEHSPPSISPRFITDQWNGGLHPLATKQSPPNHFSLNGSPPVYGTSFPESWSRARTPSISPPMGPHSRSGPYSVTSNHARRQHSRDMNHDARSQHPMAAIANPPLPHQAQPHFFGIPDPNVLLSRQAKQGIRPGDCGYNVSFDSIQRQESDASDNVVIVGAEGALDVYRLEKIKLHKIGHLEGLRGSVIDAKVIPAERRCSTSAAHLPLIAVIIHGPVLDPVAGRSSNDETSGAEMRPASPFDPGPVYYQTSVEVYSLRSYEHVATLFKTEPLPCYESPLEPGFVAPQPIGDLRLSASPRFLTLSSGSSGEIWIFNCNADNKTGKGRSPFQCITKFWTALQRITPKERPSSGHFDFVENPSTSQRRQALYSLQGRWLVIVAPSSTSQTALKGSFPSTSNIEKVPGMNNVAPPGTPLVDCVVETPGDTSMLNRVARGLTQEMIKGAQWMGTQGMSALRTYWNKQSSSGQTNGSVQPMPEPWFPPTYGDQVNAEENNKRNSLVSIFDLHKVLEHASGPTRLVEPVATFEAPGGCSFVSLSFTGLNLLTVSHAGDEQFVWDLMKLKPTHSREGDLDRATHISKSSGPIVRQVAKFQRFTEAQVVDVIWSEPRSDKLAIITHRGTIHLFEMPQQAFQWPPRTLMSIISQDTNKASAASSTPGSHGSPTPAAVQAPNSSSRGLVDSFRRHGTASLSALTSNLNITPARGRAVVASGVQKGLGAAAGGLVQLRHLGENRIRLSPGANAVAPGLVRILTGSARGHVGAISGDVLRVHTLPQLDRSQYTKSPRYQNATAKDFEFELPLIPDQRIAPAAASFLFPNDDIPQAVPLIGSWAGTPAPKQEGSDSASETPDPADALSFAEIDTTNPFQPFHTDRRVTLSVYISPPDQGGQWSFGDDIPTNVVHTPASASASVSASIPNLLGGDAALSNLNDEDLLIAEQGLLGLDEEDFELLDDI